jgi:hypothetical protein
MDELSRLESYARKVRHALEKAGYNPPAIERTMSRGDYLRKSGLFRADRWERFEQAEIGWYGWSLWSQRHYVHLSRDKRPPRPGAFVDVIHRETRHELFLLEDGTLAYAETREWFNFVGTDAAQTMWHLTERPEFTSYSDWEAIVAHNGGHGQRALERFLSSATRDQLAYADWRWRGGRPSRHLGGYERWWSTVERAFPHPLMGASIKLKRLLPT